MSAKHTPGPWEARVWTSSRNEEVIGMGWNITTGGHLLPLSSYEANDDDPNEPAANARLIAAAPELLEALQAMRRALQNKSVIHWTDAETDAHLQAIAAISKATGESA